jgi:hypothetical protein
MNALADITKETVCLKEIKDILDELNSVSYIFRQQITVVESMVDEALLLKEVQERNRKFTNPLSNGNNLALGSTKSSEDVELKYQQVLMTLIRRNKDIENLKTYAYTVYKDVRCNYDPHVQPKTNVKRLCDLLDLKQKQASVSEAMSARQEAKESARQGQTILLFTVITIIFVST